MAATLQEKIVSKFKTFFFPFFELKNYSYELLKSQIFNDSIKDSTWLKYKNFSPTGWAADYSLLYTIYSVLNTMKPKNIVEFGLGQSSKLVQQYSNYYNDYHAVTVEHSQDWIDFFKKDIDDRYKLNILKTELINNNYKKHITISYKNITDFFINQKIDLFIVDGPYGSNRYSRSQIIEFIPNFLADSFCIIIDDYNRKGEKDTAKEVCNILKNNNIHFHKVVYTGLKKHCVICSEDLFFLTTL